MTWIKTCEVNIILSHTEKHSHTKTVCVHVFIFTTLINTCERAVNHYTNPNKQRLCPSLSKSALGVCFIDDQVFHQRCTVQKGLLDLSHMKLSISCRLQLLNLISTKKSCSVRSISYIWNRKVTVPFICFMSPNNSSCYPK